MAVITNFLVLLVYGVMLGAGAGSNQVIEESQCSLDRNDEALHCFLRYVNIIRVNSVFEMSSNYIICSFESICF